MRAHAIQGHLPKVSVALSVVAIALWATGLQPADAVTVVKRALSARNADAVDHLSASRKPRPGRLLALGSDGKFPNSTIPSQARGPRGAQGPAGAEGARGPSDGYVDSGGPRALSATANVPTIIARLAALPAGSYVLSSVTQVTDFSNAGEIVSCLIKVNGASVDGTAAVLGTGAGSVRATALSATTGVTRDSPFDVTLECAADTSLGTPPGVSDVRLAAIRVATLRTSG